jgi:GLPGLI family protein
MKKTAFTGTAILAFLCISLQLFASGKPFEGVITFKITYPDNKFTESQMAMFPKIFTITIKGDKSKTEIQTPMGNQVEITDYTNQTKVGLLDIMGQKYAIKSNLEEIQKEMESQPKGTVEVTSETRVIAGYTCKKAIVTADEKGTKTQYEAWFTSELGPRQANFDNALYKDIDGVLMEFTMKTPQFTMKFSATDVEKKGVSAKEFDIPEGYVITTKEELKSKFGGMEP